MIPHNDREEPYTMITCVLRFTSLSTVYELGPIAPTCCLRILAGVWEKVACDLGLGGVFCWVLWFPPLLTTGWLRRNMTVTNFQRKYHT